MPKVCCTCLSFDVEMLSLADDGIRECLEDVANIRIELEDEFMQNVCTECVLMMKKFVKFKHICLEANQRLKWIKTQTLIMSEDLLITERNKLFSDITEKFDVNPITPHQIFIKMENETHDNETHDNETHDNETHDNETILNSEELSDNKSNLRNIIHKTDEELEHCLQKQFKYEIDIISSVNSELNESNKVEDKVVQSSEVKKELSKSPKIMKSSASIKKNKKNIKKKVLVWKSSYAAKIILTEEEEMEDFLKKRSSKYYLKSPFKCSDCVTGFLSKEKLKQHIELHDESRGAWQCVVCKLRYCNIQRLRQHRMTHKIRYKCLTCGGLTKSRSRAVMHHNRHLGVMYECKICNEKFQYVLMYRFHTRTAHPTEHICVLCGDYFITEAGLNKHKKLGQKCWKTRRMRLDCKQCDMQFFKFKPWYDHMVGHAKVDDIPAPAECQICGHKTPSWSYWSYHVCAEHRQQDRDPDKSLDQRASKTFVCDVCGKKLKSNYNLAHHIYKNHPDIQTAVPLKRKMKWTHTCEICHKQFQRNNIKRHMLIHTGEKPFKCHLCEKSFTQSNTRNAHVKKMHENVGSPEKKLVRKIKEPTEKKINSVTCELCCKSFKGLYFLKVHERTHTGEKPFECDICFKKFSHKTYIQLHKNIHSGKKPYACNICEMRFTQKCSLNRHQIVHTGERKYACDLCGTTFTQSNSLDLHVKSVHLKIPGRPRNRKKNNKE